MTDVHHDQIPRPNRPDATALGAFFALAELWELNTDQQIVLLGSPSRSTYFKWKKEKGEVSGDTQERISHLMAMFKALQIHFPEPLRADRWLRRSNRFFQGQSALEVMLGGRLQDIIRVREYLDAERGG